MILSASPAVHAERLPLKTYTTAEGLPHNGIFCIVRDSRGFLWLCTGDGLSRYDGFAFVTYSTEHGLPHRVVSDVLETRDGRYFVATDGGVARFNPVLPATAPDGTSSSRNAAMFSAIPPASAEHVFKTATALLEDRHGVIWCGTDDGLYRIRDTAGRLMVESVEVGIPRDYAEQRVVSDLVEDSSGSLWIATPSGLYRRWPDGSAARYTVKEGLPDNFLHDLMLDHEGRLWVATRYAGFFRIIADASHRAPAVGDWYSERNGLPTAWIFRLFEGSDHRFWIGTNRGLVELVDGDDEPHHRFRTYDTSNGLTFHEIGTLGEDGSGNLWIGTYSTGLMKLARNGFLTYGAGDGVASATSLFEDDAGDVCFRGTVAPDPLEPTGSGGPRPQYSGAPIRFGCFDGRRIALFVPAALQHDYLGWVMEHVTLRTRNGEWWFGTGSGIFRFPASRTFTGIASASPIAHYVTRDGVPALQTFRLFEDSKGRVWASTVTPSARALTRWDRASNVWTTLSDDAILAPLKGQLARAFEEDRAGNVWIGFDTALVRATQDRFTVFTAKDGLPPGAVADIHADSAGRLWLASSSSGLIRVDGIDLGHPTFASYSTAQGLSSNGASIVIDDAFGRIYVGTGRGLDRLDVENGRVKHFTTADGLAPGSFRAALRDRTGALWLGLTGGLSRLMPVRDEPAAAPPVLITNVAVSGSPVPMSVLGTRSVTLVPLGPNQNHLLVDFAGVAFAPGETLRYQYKLEGADADWGPATDRRSVNFASLGPGVYRFLVRAVNSDGMVGSEPAFVAFTVLRPVWQRWWFVSIAVVALAATASAMYRNRMNRILELANVRTRIATDLHDDIGANLTKIAILSEVAKQRHDESDAPDGPLSSIARISRESVAAMGDIVWAINPEHDRISDVVRRMRLHAEELFTARGIPLTFRSPDEQDLKLGADVRRDLFLIFKEAVNNAARHAAASHVDIDFKAERGRLSLDVIDDGIGFDAGVNPGEGLTSMRHRAERHGGVCEVRSTRGSGTMVRVRMSAAGSAQSPYLEE
jgi:signal transduction histidine kinase/streptogramin lyase